MEGVSQDDLVFNLTVRKIRGAIRRYKSQETDVSAVVNPDPKAAGTTAYEKDHFVESVRADTVSCCAFEFPVYVSISASA